MVSKFRGFTLIEVLIAAVILFITLSAAALSYRTVVSSNLRVENIVSVQTVIPLAIIDVRNTLRDNEALSQQESGAGSLGQWAYQWTATRIAYKPPAERFDPTLTEFTQYQPRFHRYNVDLTVIDGEFSRTVSYEEIAWNPIATPL